MNFLAVILCLGVAIASPQGRGVSIGGAGGTGRAIGGGIGGGFFRRPNVITNNHATTCGQWQRACYGQGLNTVNAFPVIPFFVQCQAAAAARNNFLIRIDFDGTVTPTNSFGQAVEDIEVQANCFTIQCQQEAFTNQLKIERFLQEVEFCGGNRR
ncbi:unnamed protein product [Meganyctiphanes norvegica]|uniref:Uncharacterized protein n=1 Tax=Meganyctiphanes norvegica TaxID=48144 RepID=A0AAV2REZ8_MEGNR